MRSPDIFKVLALVLVAGSAYGSLFGVNSLVTLSESADLIVVAEAGGGSQVGSALSFTLHVSRVLKGEATIADTSISVDWALPAGTQTAQAKTNSPAVGNGLWFLKRSSDGWQVLPVMQGGISFNQTFIAEPTGPILAAYSYSATAVLSDKIASEVSAAMESSNGGGAQLAGLYYGPLDQLGSPVTQVLYQRMSASASPGQRILGLSGLIRGGNRAAFSAASEAAASLASFPLETGVLLLSISAEFRAADSNSVAALGQAAVASANPSLPFREAAAHALAAIHTLDALPYLATLLDDPDPNLRIEAIGGFSSFANGLPTQTASGVPSLAYLQLPATAPYKTADTVANFAMGKQAISQNEAKYLSFWRSWWSQNRAALGH